METVCRTFESTKANAELDFRLYRIPGCVFNAAAQTIENLERQVTRGLAVPQSRQATNEANAVPTFLTGQAAKPAEPDLKLLSW